MVKELSILNYNNDIYKIFIEDKILYLIKDNHIEEIHRDVLSFTIQYFADELWISFYDASYSIYIVEVILKYNSKINFLTYLAFKSKEYFNSIDSLSMVIKSKNYINLIFRGWDERKVKSNIFKSNICLGKNLNIITNSNTNNYNKPYSIYDDNNRAFMLICKQYEKGDYLLYDLLGECDIASLKISNASNISLVNYNKNPIIFYNKIIQKNLALKYRFLNINDKENQLENEENISIPQNVCNPQISVYRGKFFINWYNTNGLNMATSKDLKRWDMKSLKDIGDIKLIKTNIIKVRGNEIECIKTFIRCDTFKNIIELKYERKNKYIKYENLIEALFSTKNLESKINTVDKLMFLNTEKNYRYRDYINKITELQNIIEEKDQLINKLLNRK